MSTATGGEAPPCVATGHGDATGTEDAPSATGMGTASSEG